EWITKWDGAENTDVQAVKGGLSSSMRRAAVQWGIGRYLYRLPSPWVPVDQQGRFAQPPQVPPEFLPARTRPAAPPESHPAPERTAPARSQPDGRSSVRPGIDEYRLPR